MFRKAVLALALLASANAQITKKVASFQVCGQYFTGGVSAADAANYNALGSQQALNAATAPISTWKSGGAVAVGPLYAGACGTTANTGTGIGRVVDICDPNVWQPIAVNFPCTITRATAGAGAPEGGTCPGAVGGNPTSAQVQTFCAAQTFTAPTAATAAAFCRGEIDIIGTGKYAGHALVYDYTLTPTYTLRQGSYTGLTGAGTITGPVTLNNFVTCLYYPSFAATTGRAIVAEGKYFKNGWIKKLVASVTISPARLTGGFTGTAATDFVSGTIPGAGPFDQNAVAAGARSQIPADTTGIQWAETITVTYVKPYYNLNYL